MHPDNDIAQLKFLLGILGSSLGAWYLRTKYAIYDKLHPWYTKKNLEQFPLPDFDAEIVSTIDHLLKIKAQLASVKTAADVRRLENERELYVEQLDDQVFAVFNLTAAQGEYVRKAVGRSSEVDEDLD